MRKKFNKSFEELVIENKAELMKDDKAIKKIEKKVDEKYMMKNYQKA